MRKNGDRVLQGRHGGDNETKVIPDTIVGGDSEDDQDGVETVDDDNVIDDSGMDPADSYGSDDEQHSPSHMEKKLQQLKAPKLEALRLKELAEQKYRDSNNLKVALKYAKRAHRLHPSLDGLTEMLIAFKILRTASHPIKTTTDGTTTMDASPSTPLLQDYYKILQVERFCHINTIKKQYKKLALTLHPDKNPLAASEEAFKLVGEAFRVLSDKVRRKEYDMRLRIAMQAEAVTVIREDEVAGQAAGETFWTACSTCRLLHQFERKYLGHNLVCPNCKKSFKADEVDENVADKENVKVPDGDTEVTGIRVSARIKAKRAGNVANMGEESLEGKRKARGIVGESDGLRAIREREAKNMEESRGSEVRKGKKILNADMNKDSGKYGVREGLRSRNIGNVKREKKKCGEVEVTNREGDRGKRKIGGEDEMMTLAEMQILVKKKVNKEKTKPKEKEKETENKTKEGAQEEDTQSQKEDKKEKEKDRKNEEEKQNEESVKEKEKQKERENEEKEIENAKEMEVLVRGKRTRRSVTRFGNLEVVGRCGSKRGDEDIERVKNKGSDLQIVSVKDSDFYDFGKGRGERSFKKGQVWAVYDNDGMPRRYALIDEVVSVTPYPFVVQLSWLDFQDNGDEALVSWNKMGFHISCGRFKVARRATVKALDIFSHTVDCERAAREVYRVFPKKGSVWALYNESALDGEGRNLQIKGRDCYDIVVFLTSYSEIYGLSMAYLEKVNGFNTIFKRKQIGAHAIRCLEKDDDMRIFSHQIPARKLSGEEAPGLPKDCWELDPASLPPDLLTIGWRR